jgi:hypothetical protein
MQPVQILYLPYIANIVILLPVVYAMLPSGLARHPDRVSPWPHLAQILRTDLFGANHL